MTYGVVIFSIIVQGLTVQSVIARVSSPKTTSGKGMITRVDDNRQTPHPRPTEPRCPT